MRSTSTPNTNWTAQRGCELRVRTEGLDTFAVAVLLELRRMRPLRPAATFTFFEFVMPLVGLLLGRLVGARFETPAVVVRRSYCYCTVLAEEYETAVGSERGQSVGCLVR